MICKQEIWYRFLFKETAEKPEKFIGLNLVLKFDKSPGIVTIAGRNSNTINVAIKNIRFAIIEKYFALEAQKSIDDTHSSIKYSLEYLVNVTVLNSMNLKNLSDTLYDLQNEEISFKTTVFWR